MTKQMIHQVVDEKGDKICMVGDGYFSPEQYGIVPGDMITTACRRGYVCEFQIRDDKCYLNRLLINMATVSMDRTGFVDIEEYPALNGVRPKWSYKHPTVVLYENIGLEIEYSVDNFLAKAKDFTKHVVERTREGTGIYALESIFDYQNKPTE